MKKKSGKSQLTEKFIKAASTKSGRVHVVPSESGWSVKKEGSKRATAVRSSKDSAIKVAYDIKSAKRIVIHKKDGTIQKNTKKNQ